MKIRLTLVFLLLFCASAFAAPGGERGRQPNEGAYVSASQGLVLQLGEDGKERPLEALTRLPVGTRVKVGPGGELLLVYVQGARQESWQGKAVLTVGAGASQAMTYQTPPAVKALPAYLVQSLGFASAFLTSDAPRHAMVRVRSLGGGERQRLAEQRYASLRAEADAGDILPELYLLGELEAARAYGAMPPILDQVLARQGDNPAVQRWVDSYRLRLPKDY